MLPPRKFRIVSREMFRMDLNTLTFKKKRTWEVWELGMESSPVAIRRSRQAALNYARTMGIVVEEA